MRHHVVTFLIRVMLSAQLGGNYLLDDVVVAAAAAAAAVSCGCNRKSIIITI